MKFPTYRGKKNKMKETSIAEVKLPVDYMINKARCQEQTFHTLEVLQSLQQPSYLVFFEDFDIIAHGAL